MGALAFFGEYRFAVYSLQFVFAAPAVLRFTVYSLFLQFEIRGFVFFYFCSHISKFFSTNRF